MKAKEEQNALREEVEALNRKLHELTEEELEKVTGGHVNSPGETCQGCNTAILVYGGYDESNGLHYSYCPNPNCKCNLGHYIYNPGRLYYLD